MGLFKRRAGVLAYTLIATKTEVRRVTNDSQTCR